MDSAKGSDNANNGADGDSVSIWSTFSIYWISFSFFLVFLMPCCAYRRFRAIWCRRIRLCRWNVPTDDIDEVSFLRTGFTRRYPRGDPRHVPSPADAEGAKKELLVEKLEGFTKKIEECDLVTKDASEIDLQFTPGPGGMSLIHSSNTSNTLRNTSSQLIKTLFRVRNPKDDNHTTHKEHDVGDRDEIRPQVSVDDTVHSTVSTLSSPPKSASPLNEDVPPATNAGSKMVVLRLPYPGKRIAPVLEEGSIGSSTKDDTKRCVHNDDEKEVHERFIVPECFICLNEFKIGESVSWSQMPQCVHAFHTECILKWFLTLGRNADARCRVASYDINFEMCCPVCRQDFISDVSHGDEEAQEEAVVQEEEEAAQDPSHDAE